MRRIKLIAIAKLALCAPINHRDFQPFGFQGREDFFQ